jgi:hypothetical protein
MKENLEVEVNVKHLGTTFVNGFFEWFEIKEFKGAAFGFRPNEVTSDAQFSEILNSVLENDGQALKFSMENKRWAVYKTGEDEIAYMMVNKKVLLKDSTFKR